MLIFHILVFPAEFERSVKGKVCSKRNLNVMKEFLFVNDTLEGAIRARSNCEEFCSWQPTCNGCSIHCTASCQYNAIPDCGKKERWNGMIEGDITQKIGTSIAILHLFRDE